MHLFFSGQGLGGQHLCCKHGEKHTQHETQLTEANDQTKLWKNRFTSSTIKTAITDAAVSADAYRPNQIVSLLRGMTELVDAMEDGKPTGDLIPQVRFMGTDADGKPKELLLSVGEAIKQMKEDKNGDYGNLFNSGATGGLGKDNVPGTDDEISDMMTTEQYMKNRKQILT